MTFDHMWHWRARLPDRKGQRCCVLLRAKRMNSIAVEFEDGYRVCTSRHAVRRAEPRKQLELFNEESEGE